MGASVSKVKHKNPSKYRDLGNHGTNVSQYLTCLFLITHTFLEGIPDIGFGRTGVDLDITTSDFK